jgi:hypothetical protein
MSRVVVLASACATQVSGRQDKAIGNTGVTYTASPKARSPAASPPPAHMPVRGISVCICKFQEISGVCDCLRQRVSTEHACQPWLPCSSICRTLGRGAGQVRVTPIHRRPFPATRGSPGVTVNISRYLPDRSSL